VVAIARSCLNSFDSPDGVNSAGLSIILVHKLHRIFTQTKTLRREGDLSRMGRERFEQSRCPQILGKETDPSMRQIIKRIDGVSHNNGSSNHSTLGRNLNGVRRSMVWGRKILRGKTTECQGSANTPALSMVSYSAANLQKQSHNYQQYHDGLHYYCL